MHQQMAAVLDKIFDQIASIQSAARARSGKDKSKTPRAPPLAHAHPSHVQRAGPAQTVDGKQVEGTWRAHQVPFAELHEKPDHLNILEDWMRSYKPEELFDSHGRILPHIADFRRRASDAWA